MSWRGHYLDGRRANRRAATVWVSRLGESLDRPEYPLAAVTWFAFAGLLLARQVYGWRGRRAARLTLGGFAAAVLVLAIYLVRRIVE